METLQKITRSLLNPRFPAHSLRPEVIQLTSILAAAQTIPTLKTDEIAAGETRTSQGLALSPTMAMMCADDYVRTIQFVRGAHAAIVDRRTRDTSRPTRILYVGCGPYALLAIPLMSIFSSDEATFTLLDVHAESIESAKSIVETLVLSDSVSGYETVDAALYHVKPDEQPDIIIMEIMQAGLQAEPQVAITRHMLEQVPDAILVPEEIRIDFQLVDMSCEFVVDSPHENSEPPKRDRVFVGTVFAVNRETVSTWVNNSNICLPASALEIPDPVESRYQAMLFTEICVYKSHVLKDYDSGLTSPLTPSITGSFGPGDTIQFYYELGSHPRLYGEV